MNRENHYNNKIPPNYRVNSNLIGPNRNLHYNDPSNNLGRSNDFSMDPNRKLNARSQNSTYIQSNRGNTNQNSRANIPNNFQNNIYMSGQSPLPSTRIAPPQNQQMSNINLKQESPGHPRSSYPPPQHTTSSSPHKQIQTPPTSRNSIQYPPPALPNLNRPPPITTHSPAKIASPEGKKSLRFSPPPEAANRPLPKHSVPTKLIMSPYQSPGGATGNNISAYSSPARHYGSTMQSFVSQPPPYLSRGPALQPPLPNKPPTPPPPPPSEAPPPDLDSQQKKAKLISESPNQESLKSAEGPLSAWRYQANGLPYISSEGAPILMSYPNPTAGSTLTHLPPPNYFLNSAPPPSQRLMSQRSNIYPTQSSYQNSSYMNTSPIRQNVYKRKQVDMDLDNRKNNKKRKKPLSQNIPQRKDWSVADAKRAIDVEKECNKRAKSQSLIIKFPDLELNRDIVSRFHSAIESVHFQQPSTARFCFVTLRGSADPERVIQELNCTRFGQGLLLAEVKKDREEDMNIGPEDIDPTTLYVGNLAQEVTKEDMLRTYPNTKRIDIGYAKKMKYTRYAFVSFRCVDDAIEAFKRTHSTQMHSKSLIVRFRRLHGTVGMPGEPKTNKPDATNRPAHNNSEMESPIIGPWDAVDVSGWVPDMTIKSEPNDCTDEDEDYDDYYEDNKNIDKAALHSQPEIDLKREKIESDVAYQTNNEDGRTYSITNPATDIKPLLLVNHGQIKDDITTPHSSENHRPPNTQGSLQMERIWPNETVESHERPIETISRTDNDVIIPAPIIENMKDEKSEMLTTEIVTSVCNITSQTSEQPLTTTPENTEEQSSEASYHAMNSEVLIPKPIMTAKKESEDPIPDDKEEMNKVNLELPKPIVEIVKKEIPQNVEVDKRKPAKDVVLPKPKLIKVESDIGKIDNKDKGASVLPLPQPIVEKKPVIDASTGAVLKEDITQKSNTNNEQIPKINLESEKEEIETRKIIEKISEILNKMQDEENEVKPSSSSNVHRPLIMPPEIKKETIDASDGKNVKKYDKFKSKDSVDDKPPASPNKSSKHQQDVNLPKPILLQPEVKHEAPDEKTQSKNEINEIKEKINDLQKPDSQVSTKNIEISGNGEVDLPRPMLLSVEIKKEEDDNKIKESVVINANVFSKHCSTGRGNNDKSNQSLSESQQVDETKAEDAGKLSENNQEGQLHRPFELPPAIKKDDNIKDDRSDADETAQNMICNITNKILPNADEGAEGKILQKSAEVLSSVNNIGSLVHHVKTEINEENEIGGLNDELVFDDVLP